MIDPTRTCLFCMAQMPDECPVCSSCGHAPEDAVNHPNQLGAGSILAGTYFVGHALGQGGFGITYVGWDLTLDQKVAIKEYYPEGCVTREQVTHTTVLPIPGEKGEFFQRGKLKFVEEARVLARFSNDPCVVNVRRYFQENGTAYIVMDFIEGRTIKAYADACGGKLPAEETLRLMRPVAASLSRVHEAGLLHRDISPDNIMIRPNGTMQLLDFGAARQISAEGERSNTINVKHGYAPEEQYRTHGEQGPWSDVYALCATIYRLTTGVTPPQAMDRLVDMDTLKPPNDLGAAFTPEQQKALLHGLAVRGADRTADMHELEQELFSDLTPEREIGAIRHAHEERLQQLEREGKFAEAERERSRILATAVDGTLDEVYSAPVKEAPELNGREPTPGDTGKRRKTRRKRAHAQKRKKKRSKIGLAFLCLLIGLLLLTIAAALTPAEAPLADEPDASQGDVKETLYGLLDAVGVGDLVRDGALGQYLAQNSTEDIVEELAGLLNGIQYLSDDELNESIGVITADYGIQLTNSQTNLLRMMARRYQGMDAEQLGDTLANLSAAAYGVTSITRLAKTAGHNIESFYCLLWQRVSGWFNTVKQVFSR